MNWTNDGHTVELKVSDENLDARLVCPHRDRDLTGLAFEDMPRCRQPRTEDGAPLPGEPTLGYCNVNEWIENCGSVPEAFNTDGEETALTTVPVPVAYAWDGNWYVLRPTVLLDLESALAGQEAAS